MNRAGKDLQELNEWKESDCHEWALLLAGKFVPITIKNHVKGLNAFCIWCINKKHLRDNSFKSAPIPDERRSKSGIRCPPSDTNHPKTHSPSHNQSKQKKR